MAFIDKNDPVVLNIMLTSKGREQLSRGELTFKYFTVGDSEIDYDFNKFSELNPYNSSILKPVDKNPQILSYLQRTTSGGEKFSEISVDSIPTIIENSSESLGFFNSDNGLSIKTTGDYVKQPDIAIVISGVTGGTTLTLNKSSIYGTNFNEPQINDLLLIKWTNSRHTSTVGFDVDENNPTPYLFYKIIDKISGSLITDDLIIEVDRNLPDFTNTITSNLAGGILFYSGITNSIKYSTDYVDDATLSFLSNCGILNKFPYWNLSIIYTDSIAGVLSTDKNYGQYKTSKIGGFVSYIQNQSPILKKLGVIHYTNMSPSNLYGEGFYQNTPTLTLPTLMWHKSTTAKLGLVLKCGNVQKILTGETVSLDTKYYDLVDDSLNIVGKVFSDLKMFVIEDQELLFAMSYKSNRSWTLPNYDVKENANISIGCLKCMITFEPISISPKRINGSDGKIIITGITGNYSDMILDVSSGSTKILFAPLSSTTKTYTVNDLKIGTYTVKLYDLGSPSCLEEIPVTISNPTSTINLSGFSTQSRLLSDFIINRGSNGKITINNSEIGVLCGIGTVAYKEYNKTTPLDWKTFINGTVELNLNPNTQYTIFIKDTVSGSTNFIISKEIYDGDSLLNNNFIYSTGIVNGFYNITVNNLITTPSLPIGQYVDISVHKTNNPTEEIWNNITNFAIPNTITLNEEITSLNDYSITIRQRYNNVFMYNTTKIIQ